jgi:NAD(P)H-hydrate epimerase
VRAALAMPKPIVLDADGLNVMHGDTTLLRRRAAPTILTPHPGEFARLVKSDTATVLARREELAIQFAADHGLVLVLKGHATLVTDGKRLYRNPTGNPGMATGGTGDVLTGLIAALLGQKLDAFAAAQLGVYLHGLAGDLARDELGENSLIATDLIEYLPRAFMRQPKS